MNNVIAINLAKLNIKELGAISNHIIDKLSEANFKQAVPVKLLENISSSLDVFNNSTGPHGSPEKTKTLHQLDDIRDMSFIELKSIAHSSTLRRQVDLKKAGETITASIRKRGFKMQGFRMAVKTDTIEKLISDFKQSEEQSSALNLIGAKEVVDRLEVENENFKNLWMEIRNEQRSNITSNVDAKRNLRLALSKLFKYLNAMTSIDEQTTSVVNELNTIILPFNTAIKSRETSRESGKIAEKSNVKSSI